MKVLLRHPLLLPSLFLILASVLLFAPALFGGRMLWGYDIQALEYPFKLSAERSLISHELPQWMPEVYAGMPGIAASNLVFWHPADLLLSALRIPVPARFGIDATLETALAGLGMLFFLFRLKLDASASFLGALFYAGSGSVISLLFAGHVNQLKAAAMIPWIFWAAHKAMDEQSLWACCLCGAALGLQLLGLGVQLFAYSVPVLAAFVLFTPSPQLGVGRRFRMKMTGLLVALLIALLLAAPQILPTLQYFPYSSRHDASWKVFSNGFFPPAELIEWIVPGYFGWQTPTYHGPMPICFFTFYLGLLPLALAAATAAAGGYREQVQRWMFGLALAALGLNFFPPIWRLLYLLPFYSTFGGWSRVLIFFNFAICVLAAYGWTALGAATTTRRARLGMTAFCIAAIVVASVAAYLARHEAFRAAALPDFISQFGQSAAAELEAVSLDSVRHALLAASLLLLATALGGKRRFFLLAFFLGIHLWDQNQVSSRFILTADPAELFATSDVVSAMPSPNSPEPWRIYYSNGFAQPNALSVFGYENLGGNHGFPMAETQEILAAMASHQHECLNMFNVRYVFSPSPLGGTPLKSDGKIWLYENRQALGRAWLVGAQILVHDHAEALQQLGNPSFHPESQAVLQENLRLPGGPASGNVTWLHRSPNAFQLQVSSKRHAVLMVSNLWYPAWQAWIDGKPVPVLKADGGLQALDLPAGEHQVEFRFSSDYLLAGIALAGMGMLLILGIFCLHLRRAKAAQKSLGALTL